MIPVVYNTYHMWISELDKIFIFGSKYQYALPTFPTISNAVTRPCDAKTHHVE